MASGGRRQTVILVGGVLVLASAALNWLNVAVNGVTLLRVFLAVPITLLGVFLLFRGIRASRAPTSGTHEASDRA